MSLITLGISCQSVSRENIIQDAHTVVPASLLDPNGSNDVKAGWYSSIRSQELDFFVEEALDKNFEIQSGYWKVLATEALKTQSNGNRLPSLDANFSGNKSRLESTSSTQESFSLGLNLNWEIDLWGRLKSQYESEDLEFQASEQDLKHAKISVAAKVCQSYFDLISKQKIWEITESSSENAKLSRKQIQELYERGLRSSLDVRLANINATDFESRAIEAKSQRDQSARTLEILLGRYPTDTIRVPTTLPQVPELELNNIQLRVLNNRPDVISAQNRLMAQEKRFESAKQLLLPQIRLTSGLGTSSDEFMDLVNSNFSFWNLGGNLIQPLFQGQKIRKGIEIQKARLQQAVADYQMRLLKIFQEVEFLISRSHELKKLLDLETKRAKEAQDAERTAWQQYKSGITNINTYLQTEQTLLQAQTQLLQIQNQTLSNYIQVHLALGYSTPNNNDE